MTEKNHPHNNLYLIGTPGEDIESIDGYPSSRSVSNNLYLVVARSRGQARNQVAKNEGLEFCELRATIRLAGRIYSEPCILPDDFYGWSIVFGDISDFEIPTM